MPIYWLTGNNKWQPSGFNDDGTVISALLVSHTQKHSVYRRAHDRPWDANEMTTSAAQSKTRTTDVHVPEEVFFDAREDDEYEDSIPDRDADWDSINVPNTTLYPFYPNDKRKTTIGKSFHLSLCTQHWSTYSPKDEWRVNETKVEYSWFSDYIYYCGIINVDVRIEYYFPNHLSLLEIIQFVLI